jgi:hypothetical protein
VYVEAPYAFFIKLLLTKKKKVLGYDFIIECKKGCDNSAVDALSLSRRHESGDLLAISQPIPHWLELIQEKV